MKLLLLFLSVKGQPSDILDFGIECNSSTDIECKYIFK